MQQKVAHESSVGCKPRASRTPENQADPLVTIAIPTFNRASWLETCVDAALSQTYHSLEVLVSDNASTDGTAEVLHMLSDPRLRVVRQQRNLGLVANWNSALYLARGSYIIVVSDDDIVEPTYVEQCVGLISQEPRLPIVVGQANIRFLPENVVKPASLPDLTTGIWPGTDILCAFLEGRISAQMCGICLRRDLALAGGGFRPDFPHACDIACWAPLLLKGNAGFIREGLVTYQVHDAAWTSRIDEDARLKEVERFSQLLVDGAAAETIDGHTRRVIRSRAKFFVANTALYRVALRRGAGDSIWATAQSVWRVRSYVAEAGISNGLRIAKALTGLFLPDTLLRSLRAFSHTFGRTRV
jgi:glycosyltransferase involved in cell wall biosynthesis